MGLFDKVDPVKELGAKVDQLSQQMQGLTSNIEKITGAVQTLHQNQTQMQQDFGAMKSEFSGNDHHYQSVATHERQQEEKVRGLHEYGDDELQGMTEQQKWLIQQEYMDSRMRANLEKALNPIGEQFSNLQQTTAKERAQAQLEKVMKETGPDGKLLRPDFNDLIGTMVELKKDPSMSNLPFDKLYTLAQGEFKLKNPEKYAALQEKYNPQPQQNMRQPYGGFLSATLQETGEPGDMPIKDAAQAAAREVLENVGSLPGADELGDLPS